MDFSFSEDQEALRELARKILEDVSTHERLRIVEESEDRFDSALWAELAKSNLLGVAVDERHGGSGFGFFETCVLLEEIGRAVAKVPVLPTLVAAQCVQEHGDDALRERLLPGVVAGDVILSAALAEPGDPEPTDPRTRARRDGATCILDGTKCFVPAAHLAEAILVPARADDGRVGLFVVDPRAEGASVERVETTDRNLEGRLSLAGARAEMLGDLAGGAARVRELVDRTTVALCAVQTGVTERALRLTAAYMGQREQFGRPIGSFQAAHMRAGDAFIDVETIRLTMWRAASGIADGRPDAEAIAIAKFFASEAAYRVVYAALHLHGGIGSDVDYPVHRYYLWAKQIELSLGGTHTQLERIGAALAG